MDAIGSFANSTVALIVVLGIIIFFHESGHFLLAKAFGMRVFIFSFGFGNPGDVPVAGDWDGDGITEVGLHRPESGAFYYRNTLTSGIADGMFWFGDPGDHLVSGDFGDGDGEDSPGVYRPSESRFYFRHSLTPGAADQQFTWGDADWLPVTGRFELDA